MVSLAGAAGWFVYHRFQQAVHRTTAPELVDYIDSISADTIRSDVSPREVLPPDSTYELSSVEEQPSLANSQQVQAALARNYPPLLRDAGVSGQVVVRMRVQPDGTVDPQSITVEQSTHDAFSTAAVRVAEIMRFRPAKVQAKPVPVWVTLPIIFQIAT
jgi:protein TonB